MVLLKAVCFPFILYTLYNTVDYWYWSISWMVQLITLSAVSWALSRALVRRFLCKKLLNRIDPSDKIILMTGCASGFGFAATVELNRLGYFVLAGCRDTNESRAKKLLASVANPRRLRLIKLDVTNVDDIRAAHETVNKLIEERVEGVTQLHALINNAGYSTAHLTESGDPYDMEIYEKHMDVNYLAPIRLTRVMLPLIRKTKGRVIMIGSQATRTCGYFISPYSASKSALAKLSECLRLEVKAFGVKIIDIEPSFFETKMSNLPKISKDVEDSLALSSDEVKKAYKETGCIDELIKLSFTMLADKNVIIQDLSMVVETIVDAVESYEPDLVYPVCPAMLDFITKISDPLAWEVKAAFMDLIPKVLGSILDYRKRLSKGSSVTIEDNNNHKKK